MTPAQTRALAVALDGLREAGFDEATLARMQRAMDGRIEAAVVAYRKALDLPEEEWGTPDSIANECTFNDAVFALRASAATIEGMTPPCSRCRLSGWVGDGVPCPDCDGNPQESLSAPETPTAATPHHPGSETP